MISIVRLDRDLFVAVSAVHFFDVRMFLAHVVNQLVGGGEREEAGGAVTPAGQVDLPLVEVSSVLGRELLVAMTALGHHVRFRRLA